MGFNDKLKESFVSGLIVTGPFLVVILFLDILYGWAETIINPIMNYFQLQDIVSLVILAQLAVVAAILVLITIIGYVDRDKHGSRLFARLGDLFDLVPFISTIYDSVRQVAESMSGQSGNYEKAVLVEYPTEDRYKIGFVTGQTEEVNESLEYGESLHSVFIPYSPNPTQGELIYISEEKFTELELEVSEALQLCVSTGAAKSKENGQNQ
jgi:uncharacterized membrane protein